MALKTNSLSVYTSSEKPLPERVMLWNEEEAALKQTEQVGTSACGATAALNVLNAYGMTIDADVAINAVHTRLRDLSAPLPQYLVSRSVAGTTHSDIISGLQELSNGCIVGRFFHFYPERDLDVTKWLKEWLLRGGIPIATLNCQKVPYPDGTIPDAWHHQMIYGVSKNGAHLTNPHHILSTDELVTQLCSESVLMIRRNDVLTRWDVNMDMSCLESSDEWKKCRVIRQIDTLVKEEMLCLMYGSELKYKTLTSHIIIPAAYKSGVTIFVRRDSEAHKHLFKISEELPVKFTEH